MGRDGISQVESELVKFGDECGADLGGAEMPGPKGYEHGWKYVGGPGLSSHPPGKAGGGKSGTPSHPFGSAEHAKFLGNVSRMNAFPPDGVPHTSQGKVFDKEIAKMEQDRNIHGLAKLSGVAPGHGSDRPDITKLPRPPRDPAAKRVRYPLGRTAGVEDATSMRNTPGKPEEADMGTLVRTPEGVGVKSGGKSPSYRNGVIVGPPKAYVTMPDGSNKAFTYDQLSLVPPVKGQRAEAVGTGIRGKVVETSGDTVVLEHQALGNKVRTRFRTDQVSALPSKGKATTGSKIAAGLGM